MTTPTIATLRSSARRRTARRRSRSTCCADGARREAALPEPRRRGGTSGRLPRADERPPLAAPPPADLTTTGGSAEFVRLDVPVPTCVSLRLFERAEELDLWCELDAMGVPDRQLRLAYKSENVGGGGAVLVHDEVRVYLGDARTAESRPL